MGTTVIKRILIVRNDSTTAWEKSSYILKKGELGIGYLEVDGVERPIVKVGDGKNIWKNLSQSEYILEKNQIINFDFGRHKAVDGIVDAGGAGMTLSEWFLDALKVEKEPEVILPTFSLEVKIATNPSLEVGSKVEKIEWTGIYTDGQYEFGSKDTSEKEAGTIPMYSITHNGTNYTVPDGSYEPTDTYITLAGENNFGSIDVHCVWSDATRIPVNSQGKELPSKRIVSDIIEFEMPFSVEGYREGFYYGVVTDENFSESDITNSLIRESLNKLEANYSAQTINYQIPVGAAAVIFAVPAEYVGPVSVFNTTANVEMWGEALFTKIVKPIGGVDSVGDDVGKFSTNYNIYYYKPAYPYTRTADLVIKLGE